MHLPVIHVIAESVGALASGLNSLGSSPGWVYCVVFEVGKTLYLSKASLHPNQQI